jgi:acyl-CoA hydrolase
MVDGTRVSRIRTNLGPDMLVTTPRHQVDVVITEHGAAELKGKTVRERATALAEIAHPDFRDELREAAAHVS